MNPTRPTCLTCTLLTVLLGSVACTTHERVVVHDRPEVVRVQPAPPPPVVQERILVRP
jgi:hypothetical protein